MRSDSLVAICSGKDWVKGDAPTGQADKSLGRIVLGGMDEAAVAMSDATLRALCIIVNNLLDNKWVPD